MLKTWFTLAILAATGTVSAQVHIRDRAEGVCLRAETGYDGGFLMSAGVSGFWAQPSNLTGISVYGAGLLDVGNRLPVYGLKVGSEGNFAGIFGAGLELKFLTNRADQSAAVLTPKLGMTLLNIVSVHYGYNIYLDNSARSLGLGASQVSLIVNYARNLWIDRILDTAYDND